MAPRLLLALILTGILALTTIAGILLFAVGGNTARSVAFDGSVRPPGIPPTPFDLLDEHGRIVRLGPMRGTPVVVTFMYTTCKDTCPLTAQQIRGALDELGHDVPVVAVSVDPAHDTPASARSYTSRQQLIGRMRWVLGSSAGLQRIWRAYGVQPQGQGVEHSASTVLLDGAGRQRVGYMTDHLTSEDLAHDIKTLERTPGAQG